MRMLTGLVVMLAACGGPKAKADSPLVNEGSAMTENCCCKHTPIASSDGLPQYEVSGRMDCSAKQGECVADVQCENTAPPE